MGVGEPRVGERGSQSQGGRNSELLHLGFQVHVLQVWLEVAVPFLKAIHLLFQTVSCRERWGVRGVSPEEAGTPTNRWNVCGMKGPRK